MNEFFRKAVERLGFRQRAYKTTFAEGSIGQAVLVDLAAYSRAFQPDTEGLSDGELREMHGRRQLFFRIFKHVKLDPAELEIVAKNALIGAAMRLQNARGEE